MLISMTGVGSAYDTFDWGTLRIDVYSVNSRYKDIIVRCPKELSMLENSLREELKNRYVRGKVIVTLYSTFAPELKMASINGKVLGNYFEELMSIHGKLKLLEEIQLELLLDLPGVLEQPEGRILDLYEQINKDAIALLDKALSDWNEMRKSEGEHISSFVNESLDKYEKLVDEITGEWDVAFEEELTELKSKINLLVSNIALEDDPSHFEAVAHLADKWDIKEEITRSKSHIEKFREALKSNVSEGKKLNFLLQEMLREINTIASKVKNAKIRWHVVESKCLLEQMREQIQNVE